MEQDITDVRDATNQGADQDASQDDDTSTASVDELTDELLIEEISIDGMCGVY